MSTPDCGLAVCLRDKGNGLDRTKQQTKNIKSAITEMPGRNARSILASLELLVLFSFKDSLNLTANSCSLQNSIVEFYIVL